MNSNLENPGKSCLSNGIGEKKIEYLFRNVLTQPGYIVYMYITEAVMLLATCTLLPCWSGCIAIGQLLRGFYDRWLLSTLGHLISPLGLLYWRSFKEAEDVRDPWRALVQRAETAEKGKHHDGRWRIRFCVFSPYFRPFANDGCSMQWQSHRIVMSDCLRS